MGVIHCVSMKTAELTSCCHHRLNLHSLLSCLECFSCSFCLFLSLSLLPPCVCPSSGVLKDYLRELPYPLITKQLYEAVLESMARRPLRMGATGCENDQADSEHTVSLLDNLPEVERVRKS